MKICPACHAELADDVRFCSFCGCALGTPAENADFSAQQPDVNTASAAPASAPAAPARRVSPMPFIGLGLGILAIILCAHIGVSLVLAVAGLVISIIGCRRKNKLYGFGIAGIPTALLAVLLAIVVGGSVAAANAVEAANESYLQEAVDDTAEEAADVADDAAAEDASDIRTAGDTAAEETEEAVQAETAAEVTIEEQVLMDQDGVKITATGMESGLFGPELNLLIENNTTSDLTFQIRNANVNGFMADTMMSEEVAAGKKANTEITFTTNGLEACGIETFTEIEFNFHIFYSDSWDDYIDSNTVRIETSAYGEYTQTVDDSGTVFYDQDGIRIIGKELSADDSVFGPGLILYIENNSSRNFTVQVRDTSVNGFMVDTTMSQDVMVGKKAITALTFFSSSLDENGITTIESIETSFHVFDSDTWDTIVDTDPITITF